MQVQKEKKYYHVYYFLLKGKTSMLFTQLFPKSNFLSLPMASTVR